MSVPYTIIDPDATKVFDFGPPYGRAFYQQYILLPDTRHIQQEYNFNTRVWEDTGTELTTGPDPNAFWTMGTPLDDGQERFIFRLRVEPSNS